MTKICSVQGCGRPFCAKGLCNTHYAQMRATGTVTTGAPRAYGRKLCQVEGCANPHRQGGYCQFHHERAAAGTNLTRPKREMEWHGLAGRPEYHVWQDMKNRCGNPNLPCYPNYGGRGITVCDRWLRSFPRFLADMGERPSPLFDIERIDNMGHYEPGNCRWATRKEQLRNTRVNVLTHELVAALRRHAAAGGSVRAWARQHGAGRTACHKAVSGKSWM